MTESISQKLIEAAEYMMTQNTFPGVHNNEFFVAREAFKQLAQEVEARESLWRELDVLYRTDLHMESLEAATNKIQELRKQLGLDNDSN